MKPLIALTVIASMLVFVGFVAARGPGRGSNGFEGTIETMGTAGFAMTTKEGKTIDVLCGPNTKFRNGKEDAAASDIKTGLHVSVEGGKTGDTQITANVVIILPSSKKK